MKSIAKTPLGAQILAGIVLGLIIGFVSPAAAEFLSPLGDIFLNLLKMLIVPLVFFSITNGICKMQDGKQKDILPCHFNYAFYNPAQDKRHRNK